MIFETKKPTIAIKKAYLKQCISHHEIELIKKNLIKLFAIIHESKCEEPINNIVSSFLIDTFYKANHKISTTGQSNLVINLGNTISDPVAVIIETIHPIDKAERITNQTAITKLLNKLIHYYLHERFIKNNKEIRNLIITDVYQWYIFDSTEFERICGLHSLNAMSLQRTYLDWYNGILPCKDTDWFYQEILEPFIESEILQLNCTYFDLKEYKSIIDNNIISDDNKLIDLYKVLSPQHLLKLPHLNDSNQLNKDFYTELLHIIGLYEHNENSKKIIDRLPENLRNSGSLLENTINILKTQNKLSNLNGFENHHCLNENEQFYSVALELCITWLNRVLFLKLLEGQLLKYNNNNSDLAFINIKRIKDFDELRELFFDVLAIKTSERTKDLKEKYAKIPYLNSSLFEQTELERKTICINKLKDSLEIPIFATTVLKDASGKKQTGAKSVLKYLFEFLDSYNFASESNASIQEQNKSNINASVLGLIFEKINGYKDGSFFTPGYISMYMCRNLLRKKVLHKFNETYNFNCPNFESLTSHLSDINKLKEYNQIVNSIRLCDPAVGSGHFLVSALNEIIAIKSDLGILCDQQFKQIKFHFATVENDELIITDENNQIFAYNFQNQESQRIQETLFHEKQTIIENCLFGVDINTKSVHICRLRLWIELLKNSYYVIPNIDALHTNFLNLELQTLPNIDINIKCGNSLISRFVINGTDLKNDQLKQMELSIQKYKNQVFKYKRTQDKKAKINAENEIEKLKQVFVKIFNPKDKDYIELQKIESELAYKTIQFNNEDIEKLKIRTKELNTRKTALQSTFDQKIQAIYGNSFEWRFEFPEVLDENGDFIGFDIIIGNPPYISFQSNILTTEHVAYFQTNYSSVFKIYDAFALFIENAMKLTKKNGYFSFICPSVLLTNSSFSKLRKNILNNGQFIEIVNCGDGVFEEATVPTIIVSYFNNAEKQLPVNIYHVIENKIVFDKCVNYNELYSQPEISYNISISLSSYSIIKKLNNDLKLGDILDIKESIKTGNDKLFISDVYYEGYLPLITGKDMNKYTIFKNKYILFDEKKLSRPTKLEYYTKEKLFIRRVGNNLCATYDDNKLLSTHVLYVCNSKSDKFNLKFILGLINSDLFNWIYNTLYPKKGDVFPEIRIGNLRNLPMINISENNQMKLINLVDQILKIKKENPFENTTEIENQINEITYQLYALTLEEQEIVKKASTRNT